MSSWSPEETFAFIDNYQRENIIWDPKNILHKDKNKVQDAWQRIANALNMPVEELKKKESLMTTFRGHLKKKNASMASGAGSDEVYRPIWLYYEAMEAFLVDVYTPRRTLNSEELPRGFTFSDEEDVPEAFSSTPGPSQRPAETPRVTEKRKRRKEDKEEEIHQAFQAIGQALKSQEEDEFDLFGRLMAKKVKALPDEVRHRAMFKMEEVFMHYKNGKEPLILIASAIQGADFCP